MEHVRYLVVGAGVSGLSFAGRLGGEDYLLCEADDEPGGYCKTVVQDGFVWDYSGHFFHFKHPEIERELVARMGDQHVLVVHRESRIWWGDAAAPARGRLIDFPFQKNIHQLPKQDFIDCLVDLFERPGAEPESFEEMLYAKFGRGIAERFLVPYNEKLYATDLSRLDVDAMGRFFPHADVAAIIANFRRPDNRSYNSTFTYPEGGAIQYVRALLQDVDPGRISCSEPVQSIDLDRKVASTGRREIGFDHLVSSVPFDALLRMAHVPHDTGIYTSNKVLVFNLGFDRKGLEGVHWIYFPQRDLCFYRVGLYDNIFGSERMSMYVEIGLDRAAPVDASEVARLRRLVLRQLKEVGLVDGHQLVSWHSVVMDPAYVHITRRSVADVRQKKRALAERGVHCIGRYGSWTYCSIEDNMLEARRLAARLVAASGSAASPSRG